MSLGDGGRGQLKDIYGIVQGAMGIVNLEGPVVERTKLKAGSLRLWNSPKNEVDAIPLQVRVAPGKVVKAGVLPIRAGLGKRAAGPSQDARGISDLLEAIV